MAARLPDEKIAAVKALRAKGHSLREVGALSGVKGMQTLHVLTAGISLPFGPLKRGPKKKIAFNVCKALHDQGHSIRAIAKQLGCGSTAVHRTLKTGKAAA